MKAVVKEVKNGGEKFLNKLSLALESYTDIYQCNKNKLRYSDCLWVYVTDDILIVFEKTNFTR